MKCNLCGNELTTGDTDGFCLRCRNVVKIPTPVNTYGWICPKCGNVYAPHISQCFICSNKINTNVKNYHDNTGTISVDRTQSGLL